MWLKVIGNLSQLILNLKKIGEKLYCRNIYLFVLLELEPVTIDIPMENIVKILAFYGDNPLIIVYTNHLAAFGIQYLLNMKEGDKNYYDPLNKGWKKFFLFFI